MVSEDLSNYTNPEKLPKNNMVLGGWEESQRPVGAAHPSCPILHPAEVAMLGRFPAKVQTIFEDAESQYGAVLAPHRTRTNSLHPVAVGTPLPRFDGWSPPEEVKRASSESPDRVRRSVCLQERAGREEVRYYVGFEHAKVYILLRNRPGPAPSEGQ
jgi:hypothetical protein